MSVSSSVTADSSGPSVEMVVWSSFKAFPTSPVNPLYMRITSSKSWSVMRNNLYGMLVFAVMKFSASTASRLSGSVVPTSKTPSSIPTGTKR